MNASHELTGHTCRVNWFASFIKTIIYRHLSQILILPYA